MDIIYEKLTEKTVDNVIKDLKKNLKTFGFGVLWELNFKDKIEEKNLEFKEDFIILEVCNPTYAKIVLNKNIQIGYVLPCKMVVRTENDKTFVGLASPERLLSLFASEDLEQFVKEIYKSLKKAIKLSI